MRALPILLVFLSLSQVVSQNAFTDVSYDFDDPEAKHTDAAIEFDSKGERELSLKAFQSAVKFNPNSDTLTNLGVCLMRMRRYDEAYDFMKQARGMASNDAQRRHTEENWDALMQSMEVEGIAVPDTTRRKKRRRKKKPQEKQEVLPSSNYHRDRLLHQRDAPFAPSLPRVSIDQIDSEDPAFRVYRERLEPFILTGAMDGWGVLNWPEKWQKYLSNLFPHEVTDFYPYNMLTTSRQSPYLTRLPRAVKEVMIDSGPNQRKEGSRFQYDPTAIYGRYMHLQLTPKMWAELEKRRDIPPERLRHWQLSNDDWLRACLDYPNSDLAQEYHLKTHWKIILAGTRGAGMFNHTDSLQTSSWHAHLMGSKWWYVCGQLANGTSACYESYLSPGEILYYGPGWYHETQNLETPTMTLTDTVTHAANFEFTANQLHATCAHEKLSFDFSAQLCDALDQCFVDWHQRWKGEPKPAWKWRPWRELAAPELIKKREETNPLDNNYDGRNFITE